MKKNVTFRLDAILMVEFGDICKNKSAVVGELIKEYVSKNSGGLSNTAKRNFDEYLQETGYTHDYVLNKLMLSLEVPSKHPTLKGGLEKLMREEIEKYVEKKLL